MSFAMTMFGLLKAISLPPVSIAILAYFIYPLVLGLGFASGAALCAFQFARGR